MLVIVLILLICVFWQLMALLLLRHALYVTSPDGEEDDVSTFFSVSNADICSFSIFFLHELSTDFVFAAFLASSCWVSSSMLHNGLGY